MKKILNMLIIVLVFIILYSTTKLFCNILLFNQYEYKVKDNDNRIITLLREEDFPLNITRIEYRTLLGDGELKLYKGLTLEKETIISESSEIGDFVLENGISMNQRYLMYLLGSLSGLLVLISIKGIKM